MTSLHDRVQPACCRARISIPSKLLTDMVGQLAEYDLEELGALSPNTLAGFAALASQDNAAAVAIIETQVDDEVADRIIRDVADAYTSTTVPFARFAFGRVLAHVLIGGELFGELSDKVYEQLADDGFVLGVVDDDGETVLYRILDGEEPS